MQLNKKYRLSNGKIVEVRNANVYDSAGIINVWNSVVKEKIYTMGLNLMNVEEEKEFIEKLDEREVLLIATLNNKIVGYLLLLIPEKHCKSTLHVAEIGTWVLLEYRGLGIGHFLITSCFEFAKLKNFEKITIKVRSSNQNALNFYRKHGFNEIGILKKQIKIDGKYDDHILMEKFLTE